MKQQFDLSLWLKDKSRKVVTREGKDVEIIHTNSPVPHHPIVGFVDKSIYTWTIDGKLIYGKEEQDKNDLFFADEDDKLTEFESKLADLLVCYHPMDIECAECIAKRKSKQLLDLARKELQKECDREATFKYHKELERKYDIGFRNGYDTGKQDALKSLPKWKHLDNGAQGGGEEIYLVRTSYGHYFTTSAIAGECDYLILTDLEKLPKS